VREAGNPSPSLDVKNEWSHTSTSSYVFMACCMIKHKDYFTRLDFLIHEHNSLIAVMPDGWNIDM
jgi:hypothetical protein